MSVIKCLNLFTLCLICVSCTHDVVEPNLNEGTNSGSAETICTTYVSPSIPLLDSVPFTLNTIADHICQIPVDTNYYLEAFYLISHEYQVFVGNSSQIVGQIYLSSQDSIGFFSKMGGACAAPSFSVGDTISPWSNLYSTSYLACMGFQSCPCSHDNIEGYYGFVQIIDAKKHVGYVHIAIEPPLSSVYRVLEVRTASCAGEKMIVGA